MLAMLVVLLSSMLQLTTCQPTIADYNTTKVDSHSEADVQCDCRQVAVEMNEMRNSVSRLSEESSLLSHKMNVSLAATEQLQNDVAKQTSIITGCPPGFIWSPSVNHCYKLVLEMTNWATAAVKCRSLSHKAHLVAINSAAQQTTVNRIIASYHNSTLQQLCHFGRGAWYGSLWVGGQRVDPSTRSDFVWRLLQADSDTYIDSPLNYTNWIKDEPNYDKSNESCMTVVQGYGNRWNDDKCSRQLCSLCQIEMYERQLSESDE